MEWLPLTWEALATILTGILAVGAAIFVGKKQTEISKKQTEILERQTKLTESDLKIQLLEKRSECVSSMRELHISWYMNGHLEDKERVKLLMLIHEAELIYPPQLTEEMRELSSNINDSNNYRIRSDQISQRGENTKSREYLKRSFETDDKIIKLLPELVKKLINYSRIDFWE